MTTRCGRRAVAAGLSNQLEHRQRISGNPEIRCRKAINCRRRRSMRFAGCRRRGPCRSGPSEGSCRPLCPSGIALFYSPSRKVAVPPGHLESPAFIGPSGPVACQPPRAPVPRSRCGPCLLRNTTVRLRDELREAPGGMKASSRDSCRGYRSICCRRAGNRRRCRADSRRPPSSRSGR